MDSSRELRQRLYHETEMGMMRAGRDVMQWGRDDCALWAADIIRNALGYDPAADMRGRYTTRMGARRVLGRKGLKGAIQRIARRHKWKRIPPQQAHAGDIGLAFTTVEVPGLVDETYHDDTGVRRIRRVRGLVPARVLATVICRASGWFVGRNEKGFTAIRACDVALAWSVLPAPEARAYGPPMRWQPAYTPTYAAAHEPVSTIIGLTALISGALGVSTAVAGAIGGFLVTTTLSIGFSLASSMLAPESGGAGIDSSNIADTTTPQSVQITERQSLPNKRVIVGSAFVGGALFFEEVKPPYLTIGILVNYGEITGFDAVYVATNKLSFSALTPNTILTPLGVVDQPNYQNNLRVSLRYGAADQAVDPLILSDYPSIGAEFRQRGIATAVMRYHFGGTDNSAATQAAYTALWGQVARPSAYFVVRGVKVYDPRDPTQSLSDETTWKWSNNATLVQTYYLTREWGGRIPKAKIDWVKTASSADYDDELFACADGTMIRKHTIDGVITLNERPFEVLQKLLTANRGRVLESGGMLWVESSRPKTAIATIHDGILVSGLKYQSARAKRDFVNKLQVRFVAPNQDYQVVDGPVLSRTDLQTTDGEVLPATLALNYTQDHRRAQRLQKLFLESARLGRTITCSVDVALLALVATSREELIGSVVTVSSALFSPTNGTYMVTSVGFSDDLSSLSLALVEYDATIESSYTVADEQPFTLADLDVS